MAGNAGAVQVRIGSANVGNVGGQRAHDLRIGPQPAYVVAARTPLNRVLVEPLHGAELRATCLDRRARRETRRAMRHNAAVAVIGIITFGHRAQALFEALDAERQDAAYRAVAEAVARRLDTSVSGLVVHLDESAPHAHFQLLGVTHQGHPVSRVAKIGALRDLQTIAAEVMARHAPGIERGTPKALRLAAGENYADVVNRSVKELHADLPAEIAALETRAEAAREKAEKNERLAETARAKAAQDDARASKAAQRAETYERRAEGARAELERLSAEVARLRGLAEAAEARRADGQAALDRVSGALATARRDLADVDAALAQKKNDDRRLAGEVAELERRVSEAEAAAGARRAALEAHRASEAHRATERAQEASRAAQRAREAREADRALVAALEAQRAAGRELARAEGNRRTAAEILDGRRELATGRLKPAGGRYTLPPPFFPHPTEEERAEQDYLDTWCDADGHEFMPHPEPSLREYEGNAARFEAAHAAWERVEADRLDWTAREKRAIWDERAPELRRRLGAIEAGARAGLVGRAIEAARSVFDWMRERVEAARGTLGRASTVTKALEADWLDAIADYPRAHGAVHDDHRERIRVLEDQARSVWDEGARLWREVEHRREAARRPDPQPAYRSLGGPSGP